MPTTWTIAIDWDRDGAFSGDDIVTERAVQVNWFLGFREPIQDIAENSTLGLVLDNRDRRFSPEYEDAGQSAGGQDPAPPPGAADIQRRDDNAHALVGLG